MPVYYNNILFFSLTSTYIQKGKSFKDYEMLKTCSKILNFIYYSHLLYGTPGTTVYPDSIYNGIKF